MTPLSPDLTDTLLCLSVAALARTSFVWAELAGGVKESAGEVLDGADLPKGHPVLAFRARIWNSVETQERLSEQEQLALLILAWNAWREDRELSRMQLPKGGLTARNFPEPR